MNRRTFLGWCSSLTVCNCVGALLPDLPNLGALLAEPPAVETLPFMGGKWPVTIVRDLVPDDTVFMFSDPKFIGTPFASEDVVTYFGRSRVEEEPPMIISREIKNEPA